MEYDPFMQLIQVRGGRVVDPGTDRDADGTVVIDGDRITTDSAQSARTIDATGMLVLPGFVDVHTHSDFTLPLRPHAQARLRQGVTTDVTGNCGLSPFPVPADRTDFGAFLEPELGRRWAGLDAYGAELAAGRPAINVAPLVGLGSVRLSITADAERPATARELDAMRALVERAMEHGAFGASTGLVYDPGRFADEAEIAHVLGPVADRGGLYATHVRDERDGLLASVDEAIRTATAAGVARLQLSHHKAIGRENWGRTVASLALVDEANARRGAGRGPDVAVDLYPYTAGSTGIRSLLPAGSTAAGMAAFVARLAEPGFRSRILGHLAGGAQFRLDEVRLGESRSQPAASGRVVTDAARVAGVEPAEFALDLIRAEGEHLTIIGEAASVEDLDRVLRHPTSMHGSDAWLMSDDQTAFAHPRNFGSALRVLALAAAPGGIGLPAAVAKLATVPARRLGLARRGTLAPGAFADVVVIDPARLNAEVDYTAPCAYPDAVRWAFVNGVTVIEDGLATGERPGRVLRPDEASAP